jgi:hypothetical protein
LERTLKEAPGGHRLHQKSSAINYQRHAASPFLFVFLSFRMPVFQAAYSSSISLTISHTRGALRGLLKAE